MEEKGETMSEEVKIEISWERDKITIKLNGEPFTTKLEKKLEKAVEESPIFYQAKLDTKTATKVCSKCKKTLPLDSFNKDKDGKDGRKPSCKECVHNYNVEYNKKKRLEKPPEKKIALYKGVVIAKGKLIRVWSNPLEEIKALKPITRNAMIPILQKYYPSTPHKPLYQYTLDYERELERKGIPIPKVTTTRHYKKRSKKVKAKYVEPYGVSVTPELEEKVKEVIIDAVNSKTIIEKSGLKHFQVMATLKELRNKGEITRIYKGREPFYFLTKEPTLAEEFLGAKPETHPDALVNEITNELSKDFDVVIKKEAVKEISQYLNDSYQEQFKRANLHDIFRRMLVKYEQGETYQTKAYVTYFIRSGQITKKGWNTYQIIKDNTIPKPKKDLGIIKQLFPEEEMKPDEKKNK